MNHLQNAKTIKDCLRRINRSSGFLKQDPFGLNLTMSQCYALGELEKGPVSQKELGQALNLEKSSVSRLIRSLMKRRYVKPNRDPEDRRARRIELTTTGKQKLQLINAKADQDVFSALSELSEKEVANIVSGLKSAADAIEKATCE